MMFSIALVFLLFFVNQSQQNNLVASPSLTTGEITRYKMYIDVKWIPPSQPNIVSYTILYGRTDGRTPNKTITVDASKTSKRLNDLKPFANFTVFVKANTKDGPGRWSVPATIQTPVGSAIKKCKITKLFSPSSTSVFVKWDPLFDYEVTNGIVLRWVVLVLDLSNDLQMKLNSFTAPIHALSHTMAGLKPYYLYQVIVLPETARGFNVLPEMLKHSDKIKTLEDVPSHPPANLSSTMLCKQYAMSIEWSPLQTHYRNGKLLGYQVILVNQDKTFYKNLTVTKEKVTIYLDECKNYSVQVAGMTSPGVGKYSLGVDVITSCTCGPPEPLYLRRTVVAKEGTHVSLPCDYRGRPEPKVNWFRLVNGLRFPATDLVSNDTVVRMNDDGWYACVLNNTFGTAETQVRLIVARDVVTVNFQLIITNMEFTAELKDKTSRTSIQLGLNITDAVLQKFKEQSFGNVQTIDFKKFSSGSVKVDLVLFATVDSSIEKKSTSKQIKDILVKTFYQSSMSVDGMQIGNLTLQESPGSPLKIKSTETKATSIQVAWKPPENHEVYFITSYSINHRKPNSKDWVKGNTLPVHRLNGMMDNLESSTKYEIMVAAYNRYGEGNSNILVVKTKADLTVPIALGIVIPLCLVMVVIGVFIWRKQRLQRRNIEQQLAMEQREKEVLEKKKATMFNLDVLLSEGSSDNLDKKWREIPRDYVEILGDLGSGAFGEVKRAKLNEDGGIICAVKMLKAQAGKEEMRDLVNELNIMASVGEHPNVVSLIGACSDEIPLWIIVKFAENGSLYDYLQSLSSNDTPNITAVFPYTDKLKLAFGIASGMAFLAQKRCVHRDLAARNVLLGKNHKAMVSDFGLSRDVYESGQYEKTSGGKLPVRWMSIEALKDYIFTTQSDVWSFGVVLWEIESLAKIPYIGLNGFDILHELRKGYRLEKPHHCAQSMYDLMLECWQENPRERPQFKQLVDKLGEMLKDEGCAKFLSTVAAEQEGHGYDHVIIDKSFLPGQDPTEQIEDNNGRTRNMYI